LSTFLNLAGFVVVPPLFWLCHAALPFRLVGCPATLQETSPLAS